MSESEIFDRLGSPPRVRSRRRLKVYAFGLGGITSACAEQTWIVRRSATPARDHLRVCGADSGPASPRASISGSPPRVRSRPPSVYVLRLRFGITSACAEQTSYYSLAIVFDGDHLRVCGADPLHHSVNSGYMGSPPRVRSRPPRYPQAPYPRRITSACAEQTLPAHAAPETVWDHLRVCGADVGCW